MSDQSKARFEDKYKTNRTLWQRVSIAPRDNKTGDEGGGKHEGLDEGQIDFLYNMMDENLEHARHIENERITFNSIYIALAAGIMAFISTIPEYGIKMGMIVVLFAMGMIAMMLTYRWNNAFNRHITYAKKCYILLHRAVFPIADDEEYTEMVPGKDNAFGKEFADVGEMLPGLPEAPAYCFRPKDAVTERSSFAIALWAHDKMKTQKLFTMFYILLEITLVIVAIVFTVEQAAL